MRRSTSSWCPACRGRAHHWSCRCWLAGALRFLLMESAPDEDNPEGYLEWRPLMRLPRHPELLRAAGGKVLKLLTPMLSYLPRRHRYRVLFLDRPIEEVVESQRAMRARLGRPTPTDPTKLQAALATHRAEALARLRDVLGSAVLVVPYPELIAEPAEWAARIAAFLGPEIVPHPDQMAGAVRGAFISSTPGNIVPRTGFADNPIRNNRLS